MAIDYNFDDDYLYASIVRKLFFPEKTIKQVLNAIEKSKKIFETTKVITKIIVVSEATTGTTNYIYIT
jgi:hypothetical protein